MTERTENRPLCASVILCYDVGSKRVARVRKTVRKYLHSEQRSVMTGNLTDRTLGKLKAELEPLIDPAHDAVAIYCCDSASLLTRHRIGTAGRDEPEFL